MIITIDRVIDAPRARVWQAFTDPKDLVHWHHAGDGWKTPFAETDLRVGGTYRIGYSSADETQQFTLEGTYREIVPMEKLVYSIGMGDERLVTVTLRDAGEGKTAFTVAFTAENENSEELQRKGWTEHYEYLEKYLA